MHVRLRNIRIYFNGSNGMTQDARKCIWFGKKEIIFTGEIHNASNKLKRSAPGIPAQSE